MDDLISRSTAIEALTYAMCSTGYQSRAIYVVRLLPTIDAEPVVRCKDCRLWRPVEKHTGKCPFLIGEHQYTGDDHYCSCGERREDEWQRAVEPVRHGRWVPVTCENHPKIILGCTGYMCSECGRIEEENSEPYCHCGAKMDGGAE